MKKSMRQILNGLEAVKRQVSEEVLQMKSDPMGGFMKGILRKLTPAVCCRGSGG